MSEPDTEGEGVAEPDDEAAVDLEDIAESPGDGTEATLEDVLADAGVDPTEVETDPVLVERVADADSETVAADLAALRERIQTLEADLVDRESTVEDLESRLARKQADFQNYKKRQQERLEDEKARATEELVSRLLDVRDNLARALDQDADADIRGGVESTLRQLDQEFEREGVERIEPDPGDATDPQRHEVLMRVESDRPADTVADVHRPGYDMAGKVLRPAQVTVSDGPGEDDGAAPEGTADRSASDEETGEADDA